ncbi:MAG: hypothetical protein CMI31_12995 [Opitutae bacterium]|nr:hypothetical protein [Opitutae bacterium]|tara:strand:+ start:88 stop:486 length:399 start_codon:yes stop_codon:yes gene_type:complete
MNSQEFYEFMLVSSTFSFSQKKKKVKEYSELKNIEKELMSKENKELHKLKGLNENELELLNTFNMKELKEKALVNYVNPKVIGNKTLKRTWVKALEKTKKWGFNTFVVGIKNNKKNVLYGQVDVLLKIQEYI